VRTHEIGIRIALGATRRDILGLVLGESTGIIAVGDAIGLALAWGRSARAEQSFETMAAVTRITVSDPRLLASALALLVALAVLACYFPAQKSTRTDPAVRLRAEQRCLSCNGPS
jgi:ABC-type antimicrobial peptide transport system permease subunit